MFDITSGLGDAGHGSFGSSDNSNGYRHGRCRLRGDDFGLTARPSLLGLARTYLETQAQLWPELAGTSAVPTIADAVVEAMADDFERRFRTQLFDVFNLAGLRRVWTDIGLGYVRFSDEGSNPRSLDQQLINVLQRARRDGVFIPWHYVCADDAVSGTLACRRRGSTGIAITGCSPRITSSGPPSPPSRSGMSASRAMPRLMGMRSADMRRAEMPPPTAATHATNRPRTTPPGLRGRNSWRGWGRSFLLRALGCGGDIRRRGDGRQEPAHFEPEVRQREKARMASPA